jgi:hypothetical protein
MPVQTVIAREDDLETYNAVVEHFKGFRGSVQASVPTCNSQLGARARTP